jgi:hypothetical protein
LFEIVSDIEIRATPEKIWSVLTDFRSFPDWNPFVRSIEGEPRKGEQLRVTIHPPGAAPMTFRPRVIKAEPGRELRWIGRFLVPGLFDGEHYFQVTETEPGRCRLVHGERFSGLLVPLFRKGLDENTREGFVAMNRAIKKRLARGEAPHA